MSPDEEDHVSAHWRLDRRIPIALVIVLVVQFAGGVAAFTKVQSDVSYIRENVTDLRARLSALDNKATELESVKVEMRFINENFRRIQTKVDRLIEDRFASRPTKTSLQGPK